MRFCGLGRTRSRLTGRFALQFKMVAVVRHGSALGKRGYRERDAQKSENCETNRMIIDKFLCVHRLNDNGLWRNVRSRHGRMSGAKRSQVGRKEAVRSQLSAISGQWSGSDVEAPRGGCDLGTAWSRL